MTVAVTASGRARAGMNHRNAGVIAIALSVAVLSIGSTLVKETGSPGSVVAFWRLLGASLVWQLVLRVRSGRVDKQAWRRVAPAGLLFGINLVCFFTAVRLTRIANAEFTGTLAPAIVVPLAAWRLREKVPTRTIVLGVVALCGVALIVLSSAKGASSFKGDLLAVTAVFTWSMYLLLTKRIRAGVDTKVFMTVMSSVAAVVVLPVAISSGKMFDVTGKGWALIALMAITSGMLAHGMLAWSQQRVPVSTISVMQLAQPGMSTLWAFLILGESVRGIQIVGMAIVLVAVGLIAQQAARGSTPPPEPDSGGVAG